MQRQSCFSTPLIDFSVLFIVCSSNLLEMTDLKYFSSSVSFLIYGGGNCLEGLFLVSPILALDMANLCDNKIITLQKKMVADWLLRKMIKMIFLPLLSLGQIKRLYCQIKNSNNGPRSTQLITHLTSIIIEKTRN